MNTYEIEKILLKNPSAKKTFQGVFPSDLLPNNLKRYPEAYVFNTDISTGKGEHWVACFRESKYGLMEYFDSYGFAPFKIEFYHFIKDESFLTSNKTLQSIFSSVCGQYTIYFIIKRSQKVPYQEIISHFTNDVRKNDKIVYDFVNKIKCSRESIKLNGNQKCLTMLECLEKHACH